MSSECSSGCQSGWTTYFVHSSDERNSLCYRDGESFRGVEEEEGLSMISDASSGPPHFGEDDGNGCFLYSALAPADGGKKKRTLVEQQRNQHSSALDDTASSQLFNNSENSFTDCNYRTKKSMEETLDFSYDFSTSFLATNFLHAQSALRVQMGYSQCSACVKQNPTRPGSRKKGRKM
ncbi:protein SOB FIVE-LIKE 5-like [Curcuma longa]|uniref:protein SOB FIVE-LIKE 5-like n=1 Tax=Curcuma longa TaxID=136217 RepID=UPI003D9F5A13